MEEKQSSSGGPSSKEEWHQDVTFLEEEGVGLEFLDKLVQTCSGPPWGWGKGVHID